jgi:UDP-N-acetylmuramoyl-L-alanyl-D-glutamate--2,6-diaminopimelate ligase
MAAAAEAGSDVCIVTSDNPRSESPEAIIAETVKGFSRSKKYLSLVDRREAIKIALENAHDGDVVIIAGKGHEDYQEIQGKKLNFDDRRVVRQLMIQIQGTRDAERAEREAEMEAQNQQTGGRRRYDS